MSAPAPVIWLTGYSGAGKSTIAAALMQVLKARRLPVELLDGDVLRAVFPQTGYQPEARHAHVQRVAHLASLLSKHGVIPVVALISPYCRSREFARSLCPRFVEVHVATPLEVCERRDVKGLYQRARQGLIQNFTGIDDVYEPPLAPEVVIDTRSVSVEEATRRILEALELPPPQSEKASASA